MIIVYYYSPTCLTIFPLTFKLSIYDIFLPMWITQLPYVKSDENRPI